jgi:hypothetical protein
MAHDCNVRHRLGPVRKTCRGIRLAVWTSLAVALGWCALGAPLRVATFRCDVTPWPGEALLWTVKLVKVEQPLLAKGIVLEDGTNRYVICAFDWCLMGNDSELAFRNALATAAGTDPTHVAVQCLHQHAAPYADEGAYRILDTLTNPPAHLSAKFLDTTRTRLAVAVQQAVVNLELFDQIGTGQAKAERIASIRRLDDEKGRPITRWSAAAKDPKMAAAPEGPIDPWVKTITFARDGKPLARLHYYATHPQTFCCDGRASSDFVGLAREAVEKEDKVFQVYFTGCAGDVTPGKYSNGSHEAMIELNERLQAAMKASIAHTQFAPASSLIWRTDTFTFPLRAGVEEVKAHCRTALDTPTLSDNERVFQGAMRLSYVERLSRPIQVSSLQIGSVHILHLPGEPMVEFQFFAQQARPADFVAVAGYGDCGCSYLCTDKAIAEGGYEPTASNGGKGTEVVLKNAILGLLGATAE